MKAKKLESLKKDVFNVKLTSAIKGGWQLAKTTSSVWTSWPSCYDKCQGDLKSAD